MIMAVDVPRGWQTVLLGDLFDFSNGVNADKSAYGVGIPFANVLEVVTHDTLNDRLIPGRIKLPPALVARYRVRHGDTLFNRTSETQDEVGLASVYVGHSTIVFGGFVFRGRPKSNLLHIGYSKYALRAHSVRRQIVARGQGVIRANIGQRDLKMVRIVIPPTPEQRQVAEVLTDVDHQIAAMGRLIAKKQAIKQGTMQQLLTGRMRLPGYVKPWRRMRLGDLLVPRSERNIGREPLEVLSCTKHLGFVGSLEYFKNQVFSRDLSGYLVIHRGDLAYPANHIEEGSIGVQELTDKALVSPIYVVMQPREGVDTYFLQRQLKLESFRQEFARVTNASVNRRGSLRWPQFSQIHVSVPEQEEQYAISAVLRDMDRVVSALRARLTKASVIRQGMMQEFLTGRTRFPVAEEAAT